MRLPTASVAKDERVAVARERHAAVPTVSDVGERPQHRLDVAAV
jgi:hypothetical protein